jgi:hypothetical protein
MVTGKRVTLGSDEIVAIEGDCYNDRLGLSK